MTLTIKNHKLGLTLLMMSPAILLISVFFLGPAVVTFFYSLTDMAMAGTKAAHWSFIGLDNFQALLTDDTFYISLGNTVIFLFLSGVVGQQVLEWTEPKGFVEDFFDHLGLQLTARQE